MTEHHDLSPIQPREKVVIPLHGIRTHAKWQRTFVEVLEKGGFRIAFDEWYYGYFPIIRFILPTQRNAKVKWFRSTYNRLMNDRSFTLGEGNYPSIVAHSFGTYILGYALLKYENIKFDKIILCGSILPPSFPWTEIIERGQVGEVRNEYGADDIWVRLVQWFVKGSGPSGWSGFVIQNERVIQQKKFKYEHSEYLDKGHMEDYWIPFLQRPSVLLRSVEREVPLPSSPQPYGLYFIYAFITVGIVGMSTFLITWLIFQPGDINLFSKPTKAEIRSEILSPLPASRFPKSFKIKFSGKAFAPLSGELDNSDLVWSSNRGGIIGTGKNVVYGDLPVGPNRIILTATDKSGQTGVSSIDLNITAPVIRLKKVTELPCIGRCNSIALWNGWVAVTSANEDNLEQTDDWLTLYKMDSNAIMQKVSAVQIQRPSRVLYGDDRLYVASETGMVYIFDVLYPAQPQQISKIGFNEAVLDLHLDGSLLIARTLLGHTFLINVDHPKQPLVVREIPKGGQGGAGTRDDELFLANRFMGFSVLDIHNPADPVETMTLPGTPDDFSTNVEVGGDFAHVSSWAGHFRSIYIGDVHHPKIIGALDGTGNTVRLEMRKNLVFAAALADGLQIIDVENPSTPKFGAAFYEYGYINNLAINGDLLFLSASEKLIVLSIGE